MSRGSWEFAIFNRMVSVGLIEETFGQNLKKVRDFVGFWGWLAAEGMAGAKPQGRSMSVRLRDTRKVSVAGAA